MGYPRRVNCLGHVYESRTVDEEEWEDPTIKDVRALAVCGVHFYQYGQVIPEDGDIQINKTLDAMSSIGCEVVMHEILHILCELTACGSHFKKGKEEPIVQALGTGITDVLIRNPRLLTYIQKVAKGS